MLNFCCTVIHISNCTHVLNISYPNNTSLVFSLNLSFDTDPHGNIKLQSINNLLFSSYHRLPTCYSTGTTVFIVSSLKNTNQAFSPNLSSVMVTHKIKKLQSITNPNFYSYLEHGQDSGSEGDLANFTEETADELLRSDTEEMECDDKTDPSSSSSLNESFYSTKSEVSSRSQVTISRAYKAIRAARLADLSARHLVSNLSTPLIPIGALLDENDCRTTNSFQVNSFNKKRNITASYDTAEMVCVTCSLKPGHKLLSRTRTNADPLYNCPSVFILADQSFPANLPTGGDGECLRILRLEDASLSDLTDILLESLKPFAVPAGSVILIHSLSHMASVGPAAYAEDLVRARQRICGTYRTGISVLHGLPMPQGGCSDPDVVNDLTAVACWQAAVKSGPERDILTARSFWKGLLISDFKGGQPPAPPSSISNSSSMPPALLLSQVVQPPATTNLVPGWPTAPGTLPGLSGSPPASLNCPPPAQRPIPQFVQPPATTNVVPGWPPAPGTKTGLSGSPPASLNCPPPAQRPRTQRLRMPGSLDSLKPCTFIKEWTGDLYMASVSESMERDVITALIKELNEKFNCGLDLNFSTSRDSSNRVEEELLIPPPDNIIVVGSSHMDRTASALRKLGERVYSLASPHWRLNEENVLSTAKKLEDAVRSNPSATVIYQIFDSSIYFSSSAPGEQVLPRRGADGKHHVPGELVLADWATFRKIFYVAIPLLRAGGDNKKIILSPLPRYSTSKCCSEERHITNFGTKGYGTGMGSSLADIHSWADDFARGKRIKNFEVTCPGSTIWEDCPTSKKDLAAYWGSDPVHLTCKGYEKLAEKMAEKVAASLPRKRERSASSSENPLQKSRQGKEIRLLGVSNSDTTAPRWEPKSGQSGRGGHGSGQRNTGASGKGPLKR